MLASIYNGAVVPVFKALPSSWVRRFGWHLVMSQMLAVFLFSRFWRRAEVVTDPFLRTPPHEWVYAELQKLLDRTGDRARFLSDGRIEFLGRIDYSFDALIVVEHRSDAVPSDGIPGLEVTKLKRFGQSRVCFFVQARGERS